MKQFNRYLFLEAKRIFKKLPGILLGSILLLLFLTGSIFFCHSVTNTSENEKKIDIHLCISKKNTNFVANYDST